MIEYRLKKHPILPIEDFQEIYDKWVVKFKDMFGDSNE